MLLAVDPLYLVDVSDILRLVAGQGKRRLRHGGGLVVSHDVGRGIT